jgi:hypothetical protein
MMHLLTATVKSMIFPRVHRSKMLLFYFNNCFGGATLTTHHGKRMPLTSPNKLLPLRTRSDGLAPHIQKFLLIDLEQHPDASPAAIVDLRPDVYNGDVSRGSADFSKRRRAVRDRIQFLRSLKKSDSDAYWYV